MHEAAFEQLQHPHQFSPPNPQAERSTRRVIALTAGMMTLEIAAGTLFGSMALLADGWHMGTHAAALGITLFAYAYARRHSNDPHYSFGTGKVGVLGGYTSAVALLLIAVLMAVESVQRLLNPVSIQFNEAIGVAVVGLAVNLFSARLLDDGHHHAHDEDESAHEHPEHDHNLRAAYLHVLADALTSVLAIAALLAGKSLGWVWMDALMGIVGAAVISRWSLGLLRDTSRILLDSSVSLQRAAQIRAVIEADADNRVADLHIWPLSSGQQAVIVSILTDQPRPPAHYHALLAPLGLAHVTIELHPCNCSGHIP